jgi:hypothetical protein
MRVPADGKKFTVFEYEMGRRWGVSTKTPINTVIKKLGGVSQKELKKIQALKIGSQLTFNGAVKVIREK